MQNITHIFLLLLQVSLWSCRMFTAVSKKKGGKRREKSQIIFQDGYKASENEHTRIEIQKKKKKTTHPNE